MAEFSKHYDVSESSNDCCGGYGMFDGEGFIGGAIIGGLVGWAFGGGLYGNRGYGFNGYGYPAVAPIAVNNCYSTADVANLVATKDAQYNQLNATQTSEFNVLSQLYKDNTTLSSAICQLGYENAMQENVTQKAILEASAKADLCCCRTQGLIEKTACETDAKIAQIVPQMTNFYLTDQVEQLRIKEIMRENSCGFNSVNNNLSVIGAGVQQILAKLYSTTTTPTTTA